ncbi:hypothetical protein M758_3G260900 [Ceratodon purpureus]|uniref:Uncharacterized protein n=1 Tax=Ceratodon purpureus TaxID=3225 RepID=A0A8T0IQ33_CERPU|nr:hypothetical protein KC19_3G260000 [Ceratodon purpureus]KAG0585121.1 hypothetical protein KC19_3G260200 [Ceratodon purpureus]KAG0624612.1 hypothetical protein M758_3G260900 [Ceratodon purpureus]
MNVVVCLAFVLEKAMLSFWSTSRHYRVLCWITNHCCNCCKPMQRDVITGTSCFFSYK